MFLLKRVLVGENRTQLKEQLYSIQEYSCNINQERLPCIYRKRNKPVFTLWCGIGRFPK